MFVTFEQNNSGGYLLEDKEYGIGSYVIVEVDTIKEAMKKLSEIVDTYDESQTEHSFYEYCECCGDRWNTCYKDNSDLFDVPSIDEVPITEYKWFGSGYIHYKSGEIKYFQTRE